MMLRRHKQKESQPLEAAEPKQPIRFDKWTVDELREYAQKNSINIGNSTSVAGIAKKIMNANQD